jgi:hypothetical protein
MSIMDDDWYDGYQDIWSSLDDEYDDEIIE